ncbi:EamA family transporter [Pseudomonas sp. BGr12]|uniref:EamA family transporter n=1 Tax=Pseudomonas sp. BGr12 TaxID=2936269 RepID=UPI002559BBF7|nr:DMT family transporter [Pseudomonas sp. BJa5]MDL2426311.1 DMT family transporter [Pseudomonas sp. BJa5]
MQSQVRPFPQQISVLILAALACCFAGNHIAARIAFDDGAGLLLAILCRSGATMMVLLLIVLVRGEPVRLGRSASGWQLLAGILIAVQSFCIYSAVARIPVGLALLLVNLSPVLLALLTWAFGGSAPTRRAAALMGLIFCGLLVVLDTPALLRASSTPDKRWIEGVLFSLTAAAVFACALWIASNRLGAVAGSVRSLLTMAVVFISASLAGLFGAMPGGLGLPAASHGWWAMACLVVLYGAAFSALFICMPRLGMARNAPVMNMEPVAGLSLGWLLLDQRLGLMQVGGAALVLTGIVLLAYSPALPLNHRARTAVGGSG